jgi:NAD(P)-dependent dehydrogenase (short-subunit alcohol dehydrogenase family)
VDLNLSGRRVIITAGANGIGLEFARRFYAEGALVDVCDVDEAALARIPKGISGAICDVSDRRAVETYVQAAVERLGGVDVLINNAGISGPTRALADIASADWEKVLDVNLTGIFHVTQCAIAHLKKGTNPSIILMSSLAGRVGFPNRAVYSTSKWGVVGLTKSLSMELGADGIRVNCIQPGAVDNPRFQAVLKARSEASGRSLEKELDLAMQSQSIKHLVDMENIASLAAFLASDRAVSISGQAIAIDCDAQLTTHPLAPSSK